MTAPPTGPRPPNPAEQEAYILHLQRVPVEAIQEQTGLRPARIAAAIDLARVYAQAAMQTAVADLEPDAAPKPARIRMAVMPQLPGATIPPSPVRPAAEPAATAAAADPVPVAKPEPARVPVPDLAGLARSPEVRAWAAADGWAVPVAGLRLPGGIVLAYLKAHGGTQ